MSLAADLEQPRSRGTRPCEFRIWVLTLAAEDQAAVWAAVRRDRTEPAYWPTPQLTKRLQAAGYPGTESTVYKHRVGGCLSCPKP